MDKGKELDELIRQRAADNNNQSLMKVLRENNLIVAENSQRNLSDDEILTTSDICSLLKCDRHLVYELAETKQLRGFRLKGWKFTVRDFRAYIDGEVKGNNVQPNPPASGYSDIINAL